VFNSVLLQAIAGFPLTKDIFQASAAGTSGFTHRHWQPPSLHLVLKLKYGRNLHINFECYLWEEVCLEFWGITEKLKWQLI